MARAITIASANRSCVSMRIGDPSNLPARLGGHRPFATYMVLPFHENVQTYVRIEFAMSLIVENTIIATHPVQLLISTNNHMKSPLARIMQRTAEEARALLRLRNLRALARDLPNNPSLKLSI